MNKDENYEKPRNFKELIEFSTKNFKNNVAYKYTEDFTSQNPKVIEKTYEIVGKDIKALATALLERGFGGKRIAIIGSNRYEWVTSYFALQAGGIVAAPMDKMLPKIEIESLIQRSSVDAIIFEKDKLEIFKELKSQKTNNLNTLICMDNVRDKDVGNFSDLLKEGYELLKQKNNKYEKVEIDNEKMSIMLFT